ncbi:MAG TPA: hypothetical protein VMU33_09635 [Burkholderiaceae bacterium]|nr:hypothetical protein [Burkholderiaceae bacterium]
MPTIPSVDRLRRRALALRYRRGGSLRRLAQVASLSYSWTTKFVAGRTRNERRETLERLRLALRALEVRRRD